MFINDPTQQEFYPRRLYTHKAPPAADEPMGGFCITNSAAAPAYRDWDPATGVQGLVAQIREWHQPRGAGTDAQITEIAERMIELAIEHNHLMREGDTLIATPPEGATSALEV